MTSCDEGSVIPVGGYHNGRIFQPVRSLILPDGDSFFTALRIRDCKTKCRSDLQRHLAAIRSGGLHARVPADESIIEEKEGISNVYRK